MNAAAAGKLALCICTGAVIGAGVNEARHSPKPGVQKAAAKAPRGAERKVIQFPCEPYIVQDQMMRDAAITGDFEATDVPQFAALIGVGGSDTSGGVLTPEASPLAPGTDVPEPALLGLFGLGAAGLISGRKALLARLKS